ncbi:MAG: exopolysaccharide Pel transporter PelG [Flavobacterium sp.]
MDNRSENINALITSVKDKIGRPVSTRVVAATIESLGIRDKDIPDDFGLDSIEELSYYIFNRLTSGSYQDDELLNLKERAAKLKASDTVLVSDYLTVKAKIFAQYYPLGIFHLLPVFLQIAAIILFGYSLWTHVDFNHLQSTAVVLGVILGLIITGGFVQVIGRQASFFWNYQDIEMTFITIKKMIGLGTKSIMVVLAIIVVINVFFNIYPFLMLTVIFIYAFLIGLLLLVLAPYHTVKQRWMITVSILFGTALTVCLNKFTTTHIYLTHWSGISLAILICWMYLLLYFKTLLKGKIPKKLTVNPAVFLYHNYQYFIYGFLVFIFIFTDRILAWSISDNGSPLPFLIYFEKNYELGMDLAILAFLLLAGVMEYSIASFTKFLDIYQKNTAYNKFEQFNNQLKKLYKQHILFLFLTGVFIFILIYLVITAPWGYKGQFNEELEKVSVVVSFIGATGYIFLAWGMLNTLYLFTLGKPTKSLQSMIIACIVNVTIGLICSRFISFEYSSIGMLCGAFVFMIMTYKALIKFLNKLDYHYYASY